jgi:hypothetical protein
MRGPRVVDAVSAAARRAVPVVFRNMINQSGPGAWRGFQISEVISLAPTQWVTPDIAYLRRVALRLCGARQVDATWVVVVDFPNAQSALFSRSASYFLYSGSRWRFWFNSWLQR